MRHIGILRTWREDGVFRLALAVAASVLLLAACGELGAGTGPISKRIGEATDDPSLKELDLSKLTTFGWDRFYFFKAGTTREEICKFMTAKRTRCGRILHYEVVPADHVALLFGLKGHLTHTELHALDNGRFDLTLDESGLARERCVFKVRRSPSGGERDTVWLEMP